MDHIFKNKEYKDILGEVLSHLVSDPVEIFRFKLNHISTYIRSYLSSDNFQSKFMPFTGQRLVEVINNDYDEKTVKLENIIPCSDFWETLEWYGDDEEEGFEPCMICFPVNEYYKYCWNEHFVWYSNYVRVKKFLYLLSATQSDNVCNSLSLSDLVENIGQLLLVPYYASEYGEKFNLNIEITKEGLYYNFSELVYLLKKLGGMIICEYYTVPKNLKKCKTLEHVRLEYLFDEIEVNNNKCPAIFLKTQGEFDIEPFSEFEISSKFLGKNDCYSYVFWKKEK